MALPIAENRNERSNDEEGALMLSITKCMVAGAMAALFTTAGAQQQQGPCTDDVAKLCKDVQPGEGRILSCLVSHKKDLSSKCGSYMSEVQKTLSDLTQVCEPDIEKLCMNTPAGKGAIAKCLKQHSEELSAGCKGSIEAAKTSKGR
jgi:hypothetical protein